MSDPRISLLERISLDKSSVKPYQGFILLCGGQTDGAAPAPISVRDVLFHELVKVNNLADRIRIPENYKDWANDSIYTDLVSFESHVAELSSVIVVVLESAGAIAELAYFAAKHFLRDKLLTFIDSTHYDQKSFIRLGLIDFLDKTHGNEVFPFTWNRVERSKPIFDLASAESIKTELADIVKDRASEKTKERAFERSAWLHLALLVCDLIDAMSLLTIGEIKDFLSRLGRPTELKDLRQCLYVLETLSLIREKKRGKQIFYYRLDDKNFLIFRPENGAIDIDRTRLDIVGYYQHAEHKRWLALKELRQPNEQ